jgi:hypothetical protein
MTDHVAHAVEWHASSSSNAKQGSFQSAIIAASQPIVAVNEFAP